MIINHNMNALNAHRNMGMNNVASGKSMEKLSSGLRINRAGDDAAGLSISEKMRSQIRGLDQASRNAQDGISYIQTAEGALTEVSSMLVRLKELTVQKSTGTYNTDDTANIDLEMDSLGEEITSIATNTKFNNIAVFNTDITVTLSHDAKVEMDVAAAAGITGLTLSNATTAEEVDAAIKTVNTQRATYGSQQNRLEHTINNLNITSENLTAAESRIRDVDMAKEMMTFSKNNILQQAAQAMLAQANQQPQGVLQLLR